MLFPTLLRLSRWNRNQRKRYFYIVECQISEYFVATYAAGSSNTSFRELIYLQPHFLTYWFKIWDLVKPTKNLNLHKSSFPEWSDAVLVGNICLCCIHWPCLAYMLLSQQSSVGSSSSTSSTVLRSSRTIDIVQFIEMEPVGTTERMILVLFERKDFVGIRVGEEVPYFLEH